jgi:uncharacterized membrane protein YkoI
MNDSTRTWHRSALVVFTQLGLLLALQAAPLGRSALASQSAVSAASKRAASAPAGALDAGADYVPLRDAIARARAEGGSGDVVKIDLEWDAPRSTTTWDVTFSNGVEYELDAHSGDLLGTKQKAPAKIAALVPLGIEQLPAGGLKTFQEILALAAKSSGRRVLEMELKHLKGHATTMFEVAFVDGGTVYYDARSGEPAAGL